MCLNNAKWFTNASLCPLCLWITSSPIFFLLLLHRLFVLFIVFLHISYKLQRVYFMCTACDLPRPRTVWPVFLSYFNQLPSLWPFSPAFCVALSCALFLTSQSRWDFCMWHISHCEIMLSNTIKEWFENILCDQLLTFFLFALSWVSNISKREELSQSTKINVG